MMGRLVAPDEVRERQQIRAATQLYLAALPRPHREVLALIAARAGRQPAQVIMAALADVVERYQETGSNLGEGRRI